MKKVTVTKAYIEQIKYERDRYKRERDEIERDRQIFRDHFLNELKTQTELLGKNQHYSPSTMIERLARLLNKVERWYW